VGEVPSNTTLRDGTPQVHFTNAVIRHLDVAFHDCWGHLIWVCLTSSFGVFLRVSLMSPCGNRRGSHS